MRSLVTTVRQPSGTAKTLALSFLAFSLVAFPSPPALSASTPSAPQYVEAMAGPTQVGITWDAPSSNGGESTLTYTARVWSSPPPTTSPVFGSCTTTAYGCVVSGLVTGNTYYVDVIASNSAGASAPSASKAISPGKAGNPPTNVSATRSSSGLVTVTWTPPPVLGQGQFAWYTAEAFTDTEVSAGSYKGFCTESSPAATSCSIGGLKAGTPYYVQVRVMSSLGSSYPSWPRMKVADSTPATTSTATMSSPVSVKVTALSKAIKVSWKAPASTAGKSILGYRANAFAPSGVLLSSCKTPPAVFSCTISRLKSLQRVSIGVVALYSETESPSSKLIVISTKK